ncbi:MAG TPA: cytochrome c family protein [Alphaproteobacteria bacterium]|nr:cytochrome c family protein [Alphaproteobacteria bacterium]
MNGFEWNKLIASVLVAMLVAMIAGFVARAIVHQEMPAKNAFVVKGVPAATASATPAAPKGPAPIGPLLAKADAAAGQQYARVCGTCHSFGKGEPAKIGPNLYGILGDHHAHMAGYDYSDAMQATKTQVWTYATLNEWLYDPRAYIPGTKMTFAGIANDQDRANVIAWLRTLSDKPEPLPK